MRESESPTFLANNPIHQAYSGDDHKEWHYHANCVNSRTMDVKEHWNRPKKVGGKH